MGYYITQGSTKFSMRQENIPEAFEALKRRASGNHPSWTEVIFAKNFDDASAEYDFEFDYDEKGNIIDITFIGEKAGTEDEFFTTIAPYVEAGSYVEFSGEQAEHWQYRFYGTKCIEEDTDITYASDTDEDGLSHDEALIMAVMQMDTVIDVNHLDVFRDLDTSELAEMFSVIRNNFFTYNLNENYYYTDYVDIVLVKFGKLMETGDAWIPELQEIIKNLKEN